MRKKENSRKLLKGITVIFIANLIGAVFNVIMNFLLPKFLSIEAYANIKTYQLYVTYVGIFHLGFNDGVYLEYGGLELGRISPVEIAKRVNSLRLFQIVTSVVFIVISLLLDDTILLFYSLSIPMLNLISFFQLLYQATGEYLRYSKILNFTTFFRSVVSLSILFLVSKSNYVPFLMGYFVVDVILWIWLEMSLHRKETKGTKVFEFSIQTILMEVRSGFALRISVLSGFLLSGMDRLFVKALMDTMAFAQYSFAATVENLLNIMITPITTSLYNYFCNISSENEIHIIRNIIAMGAFMLLLMFYPTKLLVIHYLTNYSDALIILSLLFASKAIYLIIQGVYVNLYKAQKKQTKYLRRLVAVIIVGLVLNGLLYFFLKTKEAFAIATLLTSLIWLIICMIDYPIAACTIREFIYFIVSSIIYIITSIHIGTVLGFMLYLVGIIALSLLLLPKETMFIKNYVIDTIAHGRNRNNDYFK